MGVLGIITCEILENEFAHLLMNDKDVIEITVLEDSKSAHLINLLEVKRLKKLHRIPHISGFLPEPSKELNVLIKVLEVSLHRKKYILQKAIYNAVREMKRYVDAFLLGYGSCGNTLSHDARLFDADVPVFRPMDKNHLVDDCVSMFMGGRECYYSEQCKMPGTYFMTPGWTCHWKDLFGPNPGIINPELLKRVYKKYKRSLLILTPVMSEYEMKQNAQEFNKLLKLQVEEYNGTTEILNLAWKKAKSFIITKKE